MLFRKIESVIEAHLKANTNKILLVDGARQVGKTFIIRHVAKKLFSNYIEINMFEDFENDKLFAGVNSVESFYLQVSSIAGNKMKEKENTIIFIDEIQTYPHLLTLLKFLQQDNRFTFIASGSLLGVALAETTSIPMGSIKKIRMYPLDFEEFLLANGANDYFINSLKNNFDNLVSLPESTHKHLLEMFKKYLLVGGLPDAVKLYIETKNIQLIREFHDEIHEYYGKDASKYDLEHKLKIRKIYDLIPSNMENKKKRVIIKDIENIKGKTYSNYEDEFDYLINAGISLDVKAVSTPVFPLIQSSGKNLIKLYLNDVGLLTNILYGVNINAVLDDKKSINLGSLYETAVACELKAHGYNLFYYDNRSKGEVDYLIDDFMELSTVPIEVKSGKDYTKHSALSAFIENKDYNVQKAYVLSNEREIRISGKIIYIPIYFIMFFNSRKNENLVDTF